MPVLGVELSPHVMRIPGWLDSLWRTCMATQDPRFEEVLSLVRQLTSGQKLRLIEARVVDLTPNRALCDPGILSLLVPIAVLARPPGHALLSPIRSRLALDRADSRLLLSRQNPGSTCRALWHIVPEGAVPCALCTLTTDTKHRFI